MTIERILVGIRECAETVTGAHAELERLLVLAQQSLAAADKAPAERLRRRLNARGYRGNAVLAEIEAAGLHVVPKDGA